MLRNGAKERNVATNAAVKTNLNVEVENMEPATQKEFAKRFLETKKKSERGNERVPYTMHAKKRSAETNVVVLNADGEKKGPAIKKESARCGTQERNRLSAKVEKLEKI